MVSLCLTAKMTGSLSLVTDPSQRIRKASPWSGASELVHQTELLSQPRHLYYGIFNITSLSFRLCSTLHCTVSSAHAPTLCFHLPLVALSICIDLFICNNLCCRSVDYSQICELSYSFHHYNY